MTQLRDARSSSQAGVCRMSSETPARRALRQRASVPTGRAAAASPKRSRGMRRHGLPRIVQRDNALCVERGAEEGSLRRNLEPASLSRAGPRRTGGRGSEARRVPGARQVRSHGVVGVGAYWVAVAGSAGGVVVAAGQELAPFGARELSPGDLAGVAGERLWPDVPEVGAAGVVGGEQPRAVGHERR
jgi:hypothetical protein